MEKKYLSRDVIGKQVVDSHAILIGNIKDMSFDLDSKNISLFVTTKTGANITINGSDIAVLGDVILLNKSLELPPTVSKEETSMSERSIVSSSTLGLCGVCGYKNDANANFCIKCGAKLT